MNSRTRAELPSMAYTIDPKGRMVALGYGVGLVGHVSLITNPDDGHRRLQITVNLPDGIEAFVPWPELQAIYEAEGGEP